MRDPQRVQELIVALQNGGDRKLQVISDFDMTLSRFQYNGERSPTCYTMPKCFAKGCANTTGKKGMSPDVALYKFPGEPELLNQWCHKIGVPADVVDRLIEDIIEDKRGDKYRLCSCHFFSNCFYTTEEKKALKSDAVPTVFASPDSEAVKKDRKWHHALFKRMRTQPPSTASGGVTETCCLCKCCVCPCHQQVSNASTTQATTSTQTEASDFNI
ncbi:uncharacterized protein [Hyperolius riggenbachi]|uniref:uncharacterized protein isoform X2 n=1 Tax=Hyperolius riggenbachi TaxID=752182 RepID=UPI0035A340C2